MTEEQKLLSALAKLAFRLNGQFLLIGEGLARPVGLTAASWLVLGTVLERAMTVADIAREIGVTRQSVQRIADLLVDRKLGVYQPNPAHRRAKLLAPTERGRNAIRRIAPRHAIAAERLASDLPPSELRATLSAAHRLSVALENLAKEVNRSESSESAG